MKKIIAIILSLTICLGVFSPVAFAQGEENNAQPPKIRLIVPENWEMDIGDSRTVDYAMGGTEKRVLTWTAEPADVAKVDSWGRVTALKEGEAVITAKTEEGLTDSVTLKVVTEPTKIAEKNNIQVIDKSYDEKVTYLYITDTDISKDLMEISKGKMVNTYLEDLMIEVDI